MSATYNLIKIGISTNFNSSFCETRFETSLIFPLMLMRQMWIKVAKKANKELGLSLCNSNNK